MNINLRELLCYDYFKGLRLLAGKNGLSRPVSTCGMLDYELDPRLNKKYFYTNFRPHTLTLSSLFFAKDNPFQIIDAVKYLVSQEGSGLVIKNVFRLPIHESVIRYADYKDFPIFLMDDSIMFEDFIIQVFQCMNAASSASSAETLLDRLLYQDINASEKEIIARQLLPSLRSQYFAIHLRSDVPVPPDTIVQMRTNAAQVFPEDMVRAVFHYRRGAFLLFSQDTFPDSQDGLFARIAALVPDEYRCSLGIGMVHFKPEDFDEAIKESLYASTVHCMENLRRGGRPYLHYRDLGIYQALLPVWDHPALAGYARRILEPVAEFDAENRGNLMDTLSGFVQCGGDLHLLAREMGQHENTLRYRLNKVAALTGLHFQRPAHYEELALAARLFLLSQENPPL